MKKIVSLFVKYPFYATTFIVVLVLLGLMSLNSMKKATFPLVESHTINVTVSYPGATPKEMEEGVTTLIENSLRGLPGIKEFSSKSQESFANITVTGVTSYNIDELLIDVKNAVDGISNFPSGAEKPIVAKKRSMDMAMFISLTSKSDDLLKLNSLANKVEDDFLASGVISQIAIWGLPRKLELAIDIDETQLRRYNLSFNDIRNAISQNNLDIHGGTIKNSREEMKILSRQRTVKPEEIEDFIVTTNADGHLVRIGDLATVTLQFEESPSGAYIDKSPSVTFMISKLMTEDLQEISEFVNEYISEFNSTHSDAKMNIKHDFLKVIDGQLSILIGNGIMGMFLVVLLLSLLLNVRLSLWVAWGIPASFLGMFIVANLSGVTLNILSLFGMILIIGILVDDGIVIGENIFTHFERGKSPRRAAIDGTVEVLPAVFTSVITTMIAFIPLFYIEGRMEMMYEMAFVVVISLGISLFEGMFVLPAHLSSPKVLKPINTKSAYGKVRVFMDKQIFGLRDRIYLPLLNRILKHKGFSVAVVTSLTIITVGLIAGGIITYTFFPRSPSNMFSIDLALKPGVNEKFTKEKLFMIEDLIWEVNKELGEEYGDTISYISSLQTTIGNSFLGAEIGTNAGKIDVFLNPLEDTKMSDQILKRAISKKIGVIPEAYKLAVGAASRFGAPVSISLFGYDTDELSSAKTELEEELEKMTSLFNITNNSQLGSQEIRLKLKPEGYVLGLTQSSLMSQVRQGFFGSLAQRIQEGKDEIWLYVRYPRSNRQTVGQLENMIIRTPKGNFPLSRVSDISTGRSLSAINRYNGKREIRVDAYQKNQNESTPEILSFIDANILPKIIDKYPGITYQHQGQQKDTKDQMGSIVFYFGIAFFVIVLIIMIHFKSFSQGIMVLMMIPLGILGAIWGHWIHGVPLSMMSLWGIIALTGTIINDSIVFMAKYNQNIISGMTVTEATKYAGKARFRAIILTTLTTSIGLTPLIVDGSQDSKFLVPMAISLAYGIFFGTIFILLMQPVLIIYFNRTIWGVKKMFGKNKNIKPEDVETALINHRIDETLKKAMEKDFNNL